MAGVDNGVAVAVEELVISLPSVVVLWEDPVRKN